MKSLPSLILALFMTASSLVAQVGNGVPFAAGIDEACSSCTTLVEIDPTDPTLYDRRHDKFIIGENWGHYANRLLNEVVGLNLTDGYIDHGFRGDGIAFPDNCRLIPATQVGQGPAFWREVTWGFGTRTDPELDRDEQTGFGVLRQGDKTGAIRTCRRHPAVTVEDSTIILDHTSESFSDIPDGGELVLWDNQNSGVMAYYDPHKHEDKDDNQPDHNGSRIWVTILLRHDGTYDANADDDDPVITLDMKGGLLWRSAPFAKDGTEPDNPRQDDVEQLSHKNNVFFTIEGNKRTKAQAGFGESETVSNSEDPIIDPGDLKIRSLISKPRYVDDDGKRRIVPHNGPFGMNWNEIIPLYFRSVPIIRTSDRVGGVSVFPVNKPKGRPDLVKGREWNTHATAGQDPFLPMRRVTTITYNENATGNQIDPGGCPEALTETEGYSENLFKTMTITRGMLKRLPRVSGTSGTSQWVSFSALMEFRPYHLKRKNGSNEVELVGWEEDEAATRRRLTNPDEAEVVHVTRYSNPFLHNDRQANATRVADLFMEVRYHGRETVEIDWISFETPYMRKMNKEELRTDLAEAVAGLHAILKDASNETGKAQAERNLRILGLRIEEERPERIWMSQRYLSALMRGNIITEDRPFPHKHWRHMVISDYSTYDREGKTQPIWWWYDVKKRLHIDRTPVPFKRYLSALTNATSEPATTTADNTNLGLGHGVEGRLVLNYQTNALTRDLWSPALVSDPAHYANSLFHHEVSLNASKCWGWYSRRDGAFLQGHAHVANVEEKLLEHLAKGRGNLPGSSLTGINRADFITYFLEDRHEAKMRRTDLEVGKGGSLTDDARITHHVYVSSNGGPTHPVNDPADAVLYEVPLHVDDRGNYDAPYQLNIEREWYIRMVAAGNDNRSYDGTKILQQIWTDANLSAEFVGKVGDASFAGIVGYRGHAPKFAEVLRYELGAAVMIGSAGVMIYGGTPVAEEISGTTPFNVMTAFRNSRSFRNNHADPLTNFVTPMTHVWSPKLSSEERPEYSSASNALAAFMGLGAAPLDMHPRLGGDFSMTVSESESLAVGSKKYHTAFPNFFVDHRNKFLKSGATPPPEVPTLNTAVIDVINKATYKPFGVRLDPFGLAPNETTKIASKDLYVGHHSLRRELAHFGQAMLQKVPSLSGGYEEQTWQQRLAELRLVSWYGKGYVDLWSHDEARYGSNDPLRNIVDVEKVRTRHPYRWLRHTSVDRAYSGGDHNGTYVEGTYELRKNYESWDSSFYDVSILRRDAAGTDVDASDDVAEEFYLCVANRRITPIVIGEPDDDYPHGRWNFTTPVEMGKEVSGSMLATKPYAQIGSREVTLPFTYVDANGNAKLFRLTELNMALTMPIGEAIFASTPDASGRTLTIDGAKPWRGIDTVVSSTGELAVNLLPGEMKMFRVTVSPAAQPLQIGSLALNTQSKVIMQQHPTDATKVRYHMVYHLPEGEVVTPPNQPADGRAHVYYTRTKDWHESTNPLGPEMLLTTSNMWTNPIRLDMGIQMSLAGNYQTHFEQGAPANMTTQQRNALRNDLLASFDPSPTCSVPLLWSCAYPSITQRVQGTDTIIHIVFGCRAWAREGTVPSGCFGPHPATMHVCEVTFKSNTGGITGPAPTLAASQVVAMAGTNFSYDDLSAWVTPVVNAGVDNVHIAWSTPQGIGVLGKRPYKINNVTTFPSYPLIDRQQLSVRRLLTNYDAQAPYTATPLRGARYPTLNPLSNASKGHNDASLLWQENGRILYARPRLRRQSGSPDDDTQDNLGFDDYSIGELCYHWNSANGCLKEAGGGLFDIVDTEDAKIAYVSNATDGLATMPSVARSLDTYVENQPMRMGIDNHLDNSGVHVYYETESITYQVRNTQTNRSEIIRRHLIETRENLARYPEASQGVPTLRHWVRSRTFSQGWSLFHPHIVPGLYRTASKFDIPYGFEWENGQPQGEPVSMRIRNGNISDTAVWNAYSLINPATYNQMWNNDAVSETPASIGALANHDETLVDVIPNNVIVVMHPLGQSDPVYLHSPSVHVNGLWPHITTPMSTTPATTRFHSMAVVEGLKPDVSTQPPLDRRTIVSSVEPFYKPRPAVRQDRRHVGLELDGGQLTLHILVDGRNVPVSWMPMGTTQRPGDKLVPPTFEVASAPIEIRSHKALDVTLDGGLRSEIELYLDAVDDGGAIVSSAEVPLDMIPVMPDMHTKVTMLAVNGKGGNYRFRAVARNAGTANLSESIERYVGDVAPLELDGKAKEHREVVTIDLSKANGSPAARRITGIAELTVIPNPATDNCIIVIPVAANTLDPAMGTLNIVDATGSVIATVRASEGSVVGLETHSLAAGMYSVTFITEGRLPTVLRQRMVVVR